MKINWHQNPFKTTIELDDRDKQMILLAYQNKEYTEILCDLNLRFKGSIKKDEPFTMDIIQKEVDKWGDICNLEVDSEEIQDYIKWLNTEHVGDCTCVPCSCIRCRVEDMLGINTISGLGKHSAYKVQGAFGKDGNRTIDEAIEHLEKPMDRTKPEAWKNHTQEEFEKHVPRWEKEREIAASWLKRYKEEHGF